MGKPISNNAKVPMLAIVFMDQASEAASNGDYETSIAAVQSTLCLRDLPSGYRRDAVEIMKQLIEEFWKR